MSDDAKPARTDPAQTERIAEFWEVARASVDLGDLGAVAGGPPKDVAPPPAWSFGDSPGLADELLALVLEGRKTAAASLVVEYEDVGDPLPAPGDLSIVLDGRAEPRALIRTTRVEIVPFAEVTVEHASLEGEGDRTLEAWRTEHRRAWQGPLASFGHELDPSMPVVCERFAVLFPA